MLTSEDHDAEVISIAGMWQELYILSILWIYYNLIFFNSLAYEIR